MNEVKTKKHVDLKNIEQNIVRYVLHCMIFYQYRSILNHVRYGLLKRIVISPYHILPYESHDTHHVLHNNDNYDCICPCKICTI